MIISRRIIRRISQRAVEKGLSIRSLSSERPILRIQMRPKWAPFEGISGVKISRRRGDISKDIYNSLARWLGESALRGASLSFRTNDRPISRVMDQINPLADLDNQLLLPPQDGVEI